MDPFLRDTGCSGDNQYLDTTVIGTVKWKYREQVQHA